MYDGRISPVYGLAKEILLVEVEDGREVCRERRALNGDPPTRRGRRLADLGVDTLICGGITATQVEFLHAVGIAVVGQAAGPVDQVIQEYINGRLDDRVQSPSRGGDLSRRRAHVQEE